MGRLTLNMLLSFAQFEREIAGERIRDKILAYLAPDVVEAILGGAQPRGLTATRLMETRLPLAWTEQRLLLGFPERGEEEI